MKELAGGGSASASGPSIKKAADIKGCAERMKGAAGSGGALA
jgi:hypothetical protein